MPHEQSHVAIPITGIDTGTGMMPSPKGVGIGEADATTVIRRGAIAGGIVTTLARTTRRGGTIATRSGKGGLRASIWRRGNIANQGDDEIMIDYYTLHRHTSQHVHF